MEYVAIGFALLSILAVLVAVLGFQVSKAFRMIEENARLQGEVNKRLTAVVENHNKSISALINATRNVPQ